MEELNVVHRTRINVLMVLMMYVSEHRLFNLMPNA